MSDKEWTQAVNRVIPTEFEDRLLLGLAIVALPLWFGTMGGPQRVWLDGTLSLAMGSTLYELAPAFGTNPNTTRYVYLPVFAYANGVVILLPLIVHLLLGGTVPGFQAFSGVFVTAVWGYIGYLACAYAASTIFEDWRRWVAIVFVAVLPLAVVSAMYRGADLLVAALLLGALALLQRDRPLEAGVAISLATFKFTAIPAAIILTAWVLIRLSRHASTQFVLGGVVAQLPNAMYFLQRPDDFWFILENRGALSTYAYQFKPTDTFLLPVQWLGIEGLYVDVIFPIIVIASVLVGLAIALRRTVLGGLMVGYLAMSLLVPAETRVLPLVVLLFVALLWVNRWWSIPSMAVIVALSGYQFLFHPGFDSNVDVLIPLSVPLRHLFLIACVVAFVAVLVAWREAPRIVEP